ncbi:SPOSA6832_01335 [Sporobolomyces salmonicolor]|uniref:SPOSA6832_01335-mRNA-1:cds n=1 Tax=Sporidiobolus salmonicolor TaxID=5005 RepID=A0A0D6EJJ6_SPOSA|nr:SPOSA6832_01335 [Sporobolomyces salmonicolor]
MVYEYDPKNMIFRPLGRTGLRVSVLSYGGWLTVGDPVKDLIKTALDHGVNFLDNAEVYANGQSEIEMGRVLRELDVDRSQLVISTKVFFGTGKSDPNQKGLSRKHIIEGTKASLKRLQLDYVDVVFAHRPDYGTPMEETTKMGVTRDAFGRSESAGGRTDGTLASIQVRAFNWLIDQGLAFYWGTSEWTAAQIEEASRLLDQKPLRSLGLVGPCVEQPQYSMLHREKFEVQYNELFSKHGYGTTIWSPLAGGMLSGKYNDGIPEDSRFKTNPEFYKDIIKELESSAGKAKIDKMRKLDALAKRLGASNQAALALAWCIKNPNVSYVTFTVVPYSPPSVILGATKPEQLVHNFEALDVVPKLTDEVMDEIEKILDNKPTLLPTYGRA